MARIPYPDTDGAPEQVREALALAPPLNIFRMLAHAETAFRPWLRFGGALLLDAQLDARLRELAILQVATRTGARYEWIQHEAIALAVGVSAEEVAAVAAGQLDAPCFGTPERAVLDFTDDVIQNVRAGDTSFEAVARLLSPREIVELLLTIGQYMMVARVMETLDLDLDEPLGESGIDTLRRGR
jgi:alkylhydroperoxidase family enzyme